MPEPPEGAPTRPTATGVPEPGTGVPEPGTGRPEPGTGRPGGPRDGRRPITPPLPDPVAIELRPIPAATPPYDQAADEAGRADADAFAAAILAALGGDDPAGAPECGVPADGASDAGTGPDRAGAAGAGAEWPSRFAQVLAETLAGARPPAQLTPWTTERARSAIRRLGPLLTASQRPVVRRVVTSAPRADVMEMSVVVGAGPRVRALAIRLERERPREAAPGRAGRAARWVCTTVEAA
jgi:Family of unknown function (DUF6459)